MMPLTSIGGGLALVSAGNGKLTFQWKHGNPVFDDSEDETVFSFLRELPGYFGDTKKLRRSQIPSVKTKTATTGRRLEEYARAALQPAIDDGRLQSVSPVASLSGLGFNLVVGYVTAGGIKRSVTVPLGA